MRDENLGLFKKGTYTRIDKEFMKEGHDAMNHLSEVQNKYNKKDIDTLLNEFHDSVVGHYLGFSLINAEKHGLDCKLSETKDVFLESKVASYYASSWGATFNDTTFEKAQAFMDKKLWLSLSIWKNAADLMFICFGQNEGIGYFLYEKVKSFKSGKGVRSTQTIGLYNLIFNFGFKILAISKTPIDLYNLLVIQSSRYRELPTDRIITLKDFSKPY